jgi:formylglycine-generating enzyme required for sulfatase activity
MRLFSLTFLAVALHVIRPCAADAPADGHVLLGIAPLERAQYVSSSVVALVQSRLEMELQRAERLDLVEREQVKRVLEELAFQQSGVTDPGSASPIGEHLNVGKLLFGELARVGKSHFLALKVVDVRTNEVIWSDNQELGREDKQLIEGTRRIARRLANTALVLDPVNMVMLPKGTFVMGSEDGLVDEKPRHSIQLDAFYLDRSEVSRAAYAPYARLRDQEFSMDLPGDQPMTLISWHDAEGYCRHMGKRLPTEAEWEYAARGAEGRTYPWGESPPNSRLANFGAVNMGALAVDAGLAGGAEGGVLHLAGNVSEWVWDWWDPEYYKRSPEANPGGPPSGEYKVVRGGSWSHAAFEIRAAARGFHNQAKGASYLGFRCARSASHTGAP